MASPQNCSISRPVISSCCLRSLEPPRIRNGPSQQTVNSMDWEPGKWLCPSLLSLRMMLALVQGADTSSPQGQASLPPAWDLLRFLTRRGPEGRETVLSVGKLSGQYQRKIFTVKRKYHLVFFLREEWPNGDLCRSCTLCDLLGPLLITLAYLGHVGIH